MLNDVVTPMADYYDRIRGWEEAYWKYNEADQRMGNRPPVPELVQEYVSVTRAVARAWRNLVAERDQPWWVLAAVDSAAEAFETQAREWESCWLDRVADAPAENGLAVRPPPRVSPRSRAAVSPAALVIAFPRMISLVRAKCRAVPGPVWVIAIGFGAILVGTSGFYDYSGDEFYFLAIGKHLAWGYDDQPPLVPLLARGISEIFPNSPVFLRLPAAAFAVAGVVLAALLAREFGGSRRAQALAAAAYVSSPLIWYQGSLLSTATIDTALIALIAFLLVRWTRLRRDGALLIAGLVTAVALQVKYLVPIFWAAVLGALVLFGPREMLRRPMLWLGFGFAGTSSVPAVLWQSRHGWPQLEMTRAIAAEQDAYFGGQGLFPPFLFVLVGIVTGAATAGFGLWTLLRSPRLRPYRFLGFVPLVLAAAIWLADGRPYYVAGVLPVLWAAAGVELERTGPERWLRPLFATPVWVVSTLLGVVAFVPAYPGAVAELNPLTRTQMGWHEFAADIARQAHELTRADGDVAVLARHYPHAAALDHYREELALPPVHSGGRSYWYFGAPSPQTRTVVAVGYDSAFLRAMFAEVVSAGMADNRYENLVLGAQPVWICRDPARPWSELWPAFHTLRVVD